MDDTCPNNHPMVEGNIIRNKRGVPVCYACLKEQRKLWTQRHRNKKVRDRKTPEALKPWDKEDDAALLWLEVRGLT